MPRLGAVWLYRLLISILAPAIVLRAWAAGGLGERLGRVPQRGGACVWIHAASVGEVASARPLVEALQARHPDLPITVTTNTVTGRDRVRSWDDPRIDARLAPLDLRWIVSRVLRRRDPLALVIVENELWPNRIATCRTAGVPVLLAAGRMSARSARTWQRLPALARSVTGGLAHVAPQDAASCRFLAELGVDPARFGPRLNLKAGVALAPPDPGALDTLRAAFPTDSTLLAASTHEGEEAIALDAFQAALAARPDLRLILAPRHPGRAPSVAALAAERGLPLARRAAGEAPAGAGGAYLADTLGEMATWFTLAGITFLGGSLTDRGGHTPFEPVQFGTALLHGPHVGNHAEAYRRLDEAGGALSVADADDLAAAWLDLVGDAARRTLLADRARAALAPLRQDGSAVAAFLDRLDSLAGLPGGAAGPAITPRPDPGSAATSPGDGPRRGSDRRAADP